MFGREKEQGHAKVFGFVLFFLARLFSSLTRKKNSNLDDQKKKKKTDARTERQINPAAWDKGLVFVQCGTCQSWHKVADAAGLIEEVVFERGDEPAALVKRSAPSSPGSGGGETPSPELSFEPADEPHGLVAIQGEEGEK